MVSRLRTVSSSTFTLNDVGHVLQGITQCSEQPDGSDFAAGLSHYKADVANMKLFEPVKMWIHFVSLGGRIVKDFCCGCDEPLD
jgi:hypothetical protein